MISRTYSDFFRRTGNERHVFLQGGRRSGKTFATFQFLEQYVGLQGGRKILVVCHTYPQLQKTMEDFERSIGATVSGNVVNGYSSTTFGDTTWQFAHFDHPTKAQGTQCDFLFINECVNVPRNIAEVLMQSARYQCYYNYNPTKTFWGSDFQNANNVLCTTFRDNDYLTPEQRSEFEALKERAQRPTATRHDIYMYKVYYLGEFSDMAGSVFGQIGRITDAEYYQLPAQETFGLDFGFATDGDPTTLIGVKIHDRKIYVKEYIYERGLTSDLELGERMLALGINYRTLIVGDYGGMGRGRMNTLISGDNGRWEGELHKGFSVVDAPKGRTIMDGLGQMLALDGIYVTEGSIHAREEFEGYEMGEDGKLHGNDHAIDAARYAAVWALNYL